MIFSFPIKLSLYSAQHLNSSYLFSFFSSFPLSWCFLPFGPFLPPLSDALASDFPANMIAVHVVCTDEDRSSSV